MKKILLSSLCFLIMLTLAFAFSPFQHVSALAVNNDKVQTNATQSAKKTTPLPISENSTNATKTIANNKKTIVEKNTIANNSDKDLILNRTRNMPYGQNNQNTTDNTLDTETLTNRVTLTGMSELYFVPDVAVINFGIETQNIEAAIGQKENFEKMKTIVSALKTAGITEDNIKTKNFTMYKRYDYTNGQKFLGYTICNNLEIKTKNLKNISTLISSLIDSGANVFNGIDFKLENQEQAYSQALVKALDNAKEKASSLLGNNNAYKVVKIEEQQFYNYNPLVNVSNISSSTLENSSIFKGTISIKATVKAIFEY